MTQADPTATLIETICQRAADIVLERLGNVGTQTGSEWPEIMRPRIAAAYWCIHAAQGLRGVGVDAGLADCFTLKNFQNEKDTTTLHFCNRLRLAV